MSTPTLPNIISNPILTGGGVTLSISGAPSGNATISRSVSGVSGSTVIYSGVVIPLFYDLGDGLPQPLTPTSFYQYTYSDNSGTFTTPYIQPAATIILGIEPITSMIIRLLQGAFNSLAAPPGVRAPQVLQAMPLSEIPKFPFVVVNQDLMQLSQIPIGQSALANQATSAAIPITSGATSGQVLQQYSITGLIERTYRVSILTNNGNERDYYRDAIPAIFEALFNPILQPLGLDVTHQWQVSTGQVSDDRKSMGPGFYFAECLLTFEGTLDVTVSQTLGLIDTLSLTATGSLGSETFIEVGTDSPV